MYLVVHLDHGLRERPVLVLTLNELKGYASFCKRMMNLVNQLVRLGTTRLPVLVGLEAFRYILHKFDKHRGA